MVQLENELTQTQTNLDTASVNLEEKEKALQNVSSEKRARANWGVRSEGRISRPRPVSRFSGRANFLAPFFPSKLPSVAIIVCD